nr:hypothetical protein [Tanacetum cinerariifolium]
MSHHSFVFDAHGGLNLNAEADDFMILHLSAINLKTSPPATDEDSEREEEVAFFLAQSRSIGRTSRTSSLEPSASAFKFKPPCASKTNEW